MATKALTVDNVEKPQQSVLARSAQGAKFLILLQVISRALTFGVNQILLRYLTPSILGISTQLEIYQISVLFFARESFRVAVQRQPAETLEDEQDKHKSRRKDVPKGFIDADSTAGRIQTIVNLAYIPIYLGVPIAAGLAYFYINSAGKIVSDTPWFRESVNLFGVAAFWELLTEPCFVVVQQQMLYKVRAFSETVATVSRCFVTAGTAVYSSRQGWDIGVLPFAAGQMAYSLLLFITYYWQVWGVSSAIGFRLSAQAIYSRDSKAFILSYWSRQLLSLAGTLFFQSGVKHLLTQGDSLLIAALSSLDDQGIYALVSNYGGLVARMLFQPIEESSRTLFATLLASSGKKPQKDSIESASNILTLLLRFYVIFSICAVSMGPTAGPLLLNLIAGKRWAASGAGEVLGVYCGYIPLLAANGVLESFVSSTASTSQLRRQSLWMVGFSILFAGAGVIFLRFLDLGARGLVWANSVNMIARVLWSGNFVQKYFRENGGGLNLSGVLPHNGSIAAGLGIYAAMTGIKTTFQGSIMDLVKCTFIAAPGTLFIFYIERDFLLECYQKLRSKK